MSDRRRFRRAAASLLGAALLLAAAPASWAAGEVRIGLMTFRTGPFPDMGGPIAQGFNDYVAMINHQRGGVARVRVEIVECEFGFHIGRGAECLEDLAEEGVSLVVLGSEGTAEHVAPRAAELGLPILADGHGSAVLADGRVSPWVFNPPMSHMGEVSAIVQYIARLEGGFDALRNKRLGVLYIDNAFGRQPLPMLEHYARSYGFGLEGWGIQPKFVNDQRLQWRQIAHVQPDWVILWGWGPMITASLDRAAEFGYPAANVIGGWWTTAEPHLALAQERGIGYRATTYHAPQADAPVYDEIIESVYLDTESGAEAKGLGTTMYARGVVSAVLATEAIRQSFQRFGDAGAEGPKVRDALAKLSLAAERLRINGLADMVAPLEIGSCRHSGVGRVAIQQWDGTQWSLASGWIDPQRDEVWPFVQDVAAEYAKANGLSLDKSRCGG